MAKKERKGAKQTIVKSVPLIIPARGGGKPSVPVKRRKADEGGVEEGMFGAIVGYFTTAPKPIDDLDQQMAGIVAYVQNAIKAIKASPVGELELSGVEVGLAINAEGTIGIASAGVETSLTLSFSKPNAAKG